VNVARFATTTCDEIVIDSATGGRTTFKNAGRHPDTHLKRLEIAPDCRQ